MVAQDQVVHWTRNCLPKLWKLNGRMVDPDDDSVMQEILAHDKSNIQVTALCSLWSGMGHIYKVTVKTKIFATTAASANEVNKKNTTTMEWQFVVKQVEPRPLRKGQQRSLGDRRKAESYQVEANFYEYLAPQLQASHGVLLPSPFFVERGGDTGEEVTIGMSLVKGGYMDSSRPSHVHAVLEWLARFHGAYWGRDTMDALVDNVGVQPTASYWHLDTRPEEHEGMSKTGLAGRLRRAARALDACLKRDSMLCLVHGDVKDANIMIQLQQQQHEQAKQPATQDIALLYDFQYCGRGPPSLDLAYFFCSSIDVSSSEVEKELLTYYHVHLVEHITQHHAGTAPPTLEHLEQSLEVAYCDYCRFMAGWGYWGSTDITSRVETVLNRLDGGKDLGSDDAYDKALRQHFW
jgi:hypothetical protein